MSIILGITTLRDGNIDKLLLHPLLVWKVIAPGEPELFEAMKKPDEPSGFLSGLFRKKRTKAPEDFPPFQMNPERHEGYETDLDKAWHGIHFLLTGSPEGGDPPLNFIMQGGEFVGSVDVGCGPARVFRSREVQALAEALKAVSAEDFQNRFDAERLKESRIYPEVWAAGADGNEDRDYLTEYFKSLKAFISRAAEKEVGILIHFG